MYLGTENGFQVNGLRAAVYLLGGRRAVAVRLAGGAVEGLAAFTGAQAVGVAGEGVSPLSAELVWKEYVSFNVGERI